MFKTDFINLENHDHIDSQISSYVAREFNLEKLDVLNSIIERRELGSVEIGIDIDMPHIELETAECGIFLFSYFQDEINKKSLVLVISKEKIDPEFNNTLSNILNDEGINKVRNCNNKESFRAIIKEFSDV